MNNIHKSVWNEAVGAWVAVSELSKAKRKGSAKRGRAAAVVLGAGAVSFAPAVFAGSIVNCSGDGTEAASSQWVDAGTGKAWDGTKWGGTTGSLGGANCGGGSGVIIEEENSGNNDVNGSTAYIMVGKLASSDAGSITLYGPAGITLRGATTTTGTATFQAGADMSGTGIANLADGTSDKDAVNLGQLNQRTRYFHANSLQDVPQSDARADGGDSVAAGPWASASGTNSTAVGRGASALATESVALGANASAMSAQAVAIGAGANAVNAGSVALGAGSIAGRTNAVSVGTTTSQRQIINVAEGTAGTDAVNLNQLNAAIAGASGGGSPDAVAYDTSAHDRVTFGGVGAATPVTLTNLAAGKADTDAVNVSQLKAMGADLDDSGKATNAFVAYDDASKGTVTLKGAGGTRITGLSAATVNASSTDVVNGSQLYNTASSVADALGGASTVGADGRITKPAYTLDGNTYNDVGAALAAVDAKAASGAVDGVKYDTPAHDRVTFGGVGAATPVTLTNLAAGKADTDAVNVSQLKAMGADLDDSGKATNAFVAYDDASKGTVTLKGAGGTRITGLSAAAVNAGSTDAVNGSQLYNTASSVADALGGASTVGADGRITKPAYTLDGNTYNDVGAALAAVDAKAASGAVDGVKYDTPAHDRVTFGGAGAATPVTLTNLAAGKADTDAVNVSQLKAMGADLDDSGKATNAFVAYDDASKGTVTLKGAGGTRITGVSAATVNASSTDVVNGSQLYNTASSVADALGGASTVGADGRITKPAYTLDGNTYNDVGAALTAVNAKAGTGSADGVQYDTPVHDRVTFGGIGTTTPVTLTNLAPGQVSAGSKDAINGSQLYNTASTVAAALGGGSTVDISGNVTIPAYVIGLQTFSDVGSALDYATKYVKVTSTFSQTVASGDNAIAIGGGSLATHSGSVAIGTGARALFDNSIAIGTNSSTSEANTVSFGGPGNERRITNVADGKIETDVATVGQLTAMQKQLAAELTNIAPTSAQMALAAPMEALAAPMDASIFATPPVTSYIAVSDSVTQGAATYAAPDTTNAMAIGPVASAFGVNSTTIGAASSAMSLDATAVGAGAGAIAQGTTVIGANATSGAYATNGVAIGSYAKSEGVNTVAIGSSSNVLGENSAGIGTNVFVTAAATNAMALGASSTASAVGAVALGANSIADRANTISVGSSAAQRQLVNLAAGTTDTDAVNVGQLSGMTEALGGGAGVNADGTIRLPTYTIDGTPYSDVGAALVAVDSKAASGAMDGVKYDTSLHDKVTFGGVGASTPVTLTNLAAGKTDTDAVNVSQLKAMGADLDDSGKATNAFVAYDDASKGTITLKGAGGTSITGLSAAKLNAGSTDAVNGSQLYETNQNVANVAGDVTNLTNTVNNISNGGAGVKYFHANSTLEDSSATGTEAVAIGGNANATADTSVALGANASANVSNAVALGAGSVADRADTVSVGSAMLQRQIVNVAAGTADHDAVNVAQLKGVTAALGGGADVNGDGTIKPPSYKVGGRTYEDLGSALDAASAGGSPDAVLYDTSAHDRLTLGKDAPGEVVLTNVADATADTDAVNLRQLKAAGLTVDPETGASTNAFVTYDDLSKGAVTFNPGGTPTQLKNVAAGTDAFDAVNLSQMESYVATYAGSGNGGNGGNDGNGAVGPNAVQYDDASQNVVTLGGAGHDPVKLTNVAAGTEANDAVNFSQFSSLQSAVDNIAAGTGNTYISIGSSSDPSGGTPASASGTDSIAIGNGASAPGAAAIAIGAGTSTSGDHSVALGAGSSAPASNSVALGANSVADRDNSVSMGAAGAERQITNVAAGTTPTDAVNVGQMSSAINGVYQSMHDMDRDFRRGIASSAALNIVTPYLPGRTTLNAGVAGYRGQAALGIGVSRWNEKGTVNYNLGVSSAGGNSTIVRAGLGIVLGS
ncbi:ESPR-type extended signal peptide-containing protein [Paraburkholderia sp. BL10I2N1]|uniref:YadA-like family protein n=1 Tax=Paraburkholderia sp. BL10I2N1 TaxID=1938796 RepID=UPI001060BC79|nr:ESPR-type extended signal peptide-containing protein [Paraburkholderia sp. BL10I2N1]TDN62918.1 trimeric autotransporter adhesin [Paraburkholderia sp. BL10I2N1]